MEGDMLTRTGTITVQVTEQDKALTFYFYTQKRGSRSVAINPWVRTMVRLKWLRQRHRQGFYCIASIRQAL
jgi:hypothetical protein